MPDDYRWMMLYNSHDVSFYRLPLPLPRARPLLLLEPRYDDPRPPLFGQLLAQ